jgi:hypothetical protein
MAGKVKRDNTNTTAIHDHSFKRHFDYAQYRHFDYTQYRHFDFGTWA